MRIPPPPPMRKRRFKTPKTARKNLIKECDKLWGLVVRTRDRDKCRYTGCGKAGNQPHHIFSRRYRNTRHNPDNGITLCWAHHHNVAGGEPEKFRDFIIKEIGAETFERLKISAYMTGVKMDMQAVRIMLERELDGLSSKL